ncbi:MAG: hypothetical protein ABI175_13200 [Polyangiales bacterium]
MNAIELSRAGAPWRIDRPAEKLLLRARMPGAFVFDQVAHAIRVAEAKGVALDERLVLALPASWLVNAPAPSPVLRRWSEPPLREAWHALVESVKGGPDRWLACDAERAIVDECLAALCVDELKETGIESISKVLALLVPEGVPLMPAESVTFALGETPGGPSRRASFLAMLDWFSRAVLEAEAALVSLARAYQPCPLDAAQVLDRLLYFDSIGHRHFPAS